MNSNNIKHTLMLAVGLLIFLTSCTKKYKCMRYKGAYEVTYNHKEQSCYITKQSKREELKKEQCASLCYEDL